MELKLERFIRAWKFLPKTFGNFLLTLGKNKLKHQGS